MFLSIVTVGAGVTFIWEVRVIAQTRQRLLEDKNAGLSPTRFRVLRHWTLDRHSPLNGTNSTPTFLLIFSDFLVRRIACKVCIRLSLWWWQKSGIWNVWFHRSPWWACLHSEILRPPTLSNLLITFNLTYDLLLCLISEVSLIVLNVEHTWIVRHDTLNCFFFFLMVFIIGKYDSSYACINDTEIVTSPDGQLALTYNPLLLWVDNWWLIDWILL